VGFSATSANKLDSQLAISVRIVLGVFLATSDAQSADVECFASEADGTVLDDAVADCELFTLYSYN